MALPDTFTSTDRLIRELAENLRRKTLKLVTAESCTGGGIAAECTGLAGSSQWFECGFVTYSNEAKHSILGVSPDCIERWGPVSQQVVVQMAAGALETSNADISVAVSGIAGPGGGTEELPVGTVWIAWGHSGGISSQHFRFDGDRFLVRECAVNQSLAGLLNLLHSI